MRVAIVFAALAAYPTLVRAQPASAQAEVLFRQGKELMAKGQFAEACAAFDASEKLEASTSTVLNQANCREKNDQLATAWGLFLDAERATRLATDALNTQMHQTAVERAAKLEPRLSTLRLEVPDDTRISGFEVLRDNEAVDPGAWNKTLPIDGGTYKITARAPGNAEWTTTITVGNERDTKVVTVPRLKAADLERPVEPTPQPAPVQPVPAPSPPPVPSSDVPDRPWSALGTGAGAIALFGGALAFELAGESSYDRAKANLDPTQQVSLWHTANDERYIAEGLAVAGVAAAGVAVWLYVHAHARVAPLVGADRAGIAIAGGF